MSAGCHFWRVRGCRSGCLLGSAGAENAVRSLYAAACPLCCVVMGFLGRVPQAEGGRPYSNCLQFHAIISRSILWATVTDLPRVLGTHGTLLHCGVATSLYQESMATGAPVSYVWKLVCHLGERLVFMCLMTVIIVHSVCVFIDGLFLFPRPAFT